MKLKNERKTIIMFTIIIIIQTVIFIVAGINKSYIHMDEAYSLGLSNYDKIQIYENEDFYDTWHTKEYYEDYLVVNQDEKYDFSPVYENQKNDVHPPLYYLLLRIAMQFNIDNYSKWPGLIVNIIIYVFITIFIYLILKKLLSGEENYKEKSAVLALVSSITLASISNAIYIRMYALSTLNIAITTYLHLKLLDTKEINYKLLVAIGASALVGSLTHYYYLFYLAMIFIMFVIKYIKEKRYKELISYILTMCFAGIISIIIFPYSIQHMFFSYRGQGAMGNLSKISNFINSIYEYILKTNRYAFNNTLFIILIFLLVLIIYKKIRKIKLIEKHNKYIKYIALPTLFYFLLVAISSPWIELRYIMPICNMVFILVFYASLVLLKNVFNDKIVNKIAIVILLLVLIMPIIQNTADKIFTSVDCKIEPEVMYSDRKELVDKLKNELNLPTLYIFNSNDNRFLDEIILFSNINESYIAKDLQCNEENINEIIKDKNVQNGMIVFINNGQDNDSILETIKASSGLENVIWLKRLVSCDVYLIENN